MIEHLNKFFGEQRRVLADASHELRTPVTIVLGEAEVALRGPEKSSHEYRSALANIVDVSNHMRKLIDDILFLERAEIGHIPYEMNKVPLVTLLKDVAHKNRSLTATRELKLCFDEKSSVDVWGDVQRLRQLVIILLDNAIKHTNALGNVKLTVTSESKFVRLMVSDDGIGISDRDLPYVFERFYRADATRSCVENGTGLGLAVAQSIVKAHRGEIFVDSALGRGTVFSVLIPRAPLQG